tara:strand:- start:3492 stop:3833 length:342 start_codon:yes stop_codon:yes gene_type:complete
MAIIAGIADFTVAKRNDFPLTLTFKDSTGSAINLNGYTVEGEVYNEDRTTKFADWSVTYTNRTSGIIDIKLDDTDTTNFTLPTLFYDIQLTEPSGNKFQYLKGTLFITEGYTS